MKLIDIEQENYNKISDLENMFSVHVDKRDNYAFNLNESIYLNIPKSRMRVFIPDHPMHWPLISYKVYDSTRLYWLLMKVNGVTTRNIFLPIPAGVPVYYPADTDLQTIVNVINETNR